MQHGLSQQGSTGKGKQNLNYRGVDSLWYKLAAEKQNESCHEAD
jgi:hypothetical protein